MNEEQDQVEAQAEESRLKDDADRRAERLRERQEAADLRWAERIEARRVEEQKQEQERERKEEERVQRDEERWEALRAEVRREEEEREKRNDERWEERLREEREAAGIFPVQPVGEEQRARMEARGTRG